MSYTQQFIKEAERYANQKLRTITIGPNVLVTERCKEIVRRVKKSGFDTPVVVAAALCKVLEYTHESEIKIKQLFGDDVGLMVAGITKTFLTPEQQTEPGSETKEMQLKVAAKSLEQTALIEPGILAIKMAEQLAFFDVTPGIQQNITRHFMPVYNAIFPLLEISEKEMQGLENLKKELGDMINN